MQSLAQSQKLIRQKKLSLIISLLFLKFIAYFYYKHRSPSYKFKGKYNCRQVGPYRTQVMKFDGRYKKAGSQNIVLVNITGNPGVIQFYDKFLSKLHELLDYEIDIYSIGQIHHYKYPGKPKLKTHNLQQNLEHKQLFLQQLLEENPNTKFILMGHSIGAYMCLYAMKVLKKEQILKTYMMYPTIFKMYKSPSGQRNKLLNYTVLLYLASFVIGSIKKTVPEFILRGIFRKGFKNNEDVVECILYMLSFSNSLNAMALGKEEMEVLDHLDEDLVKENLEKCHYYFGTKDGWVPMSYVNHLIKTFPDMHYTIDKHEMEHAYMIGGGLKQAEVHFEHIKQDVPQLFEKSQE